MAFEGFYIKLSNIAKLPHTDTYYACFEYKNKYKDKFNITDTLASSCIVNFNNSIFSSKEKAFKQLINFYTYEDEGEKKIIMGKYNLANPHEKLIDLFFTEVVHIYNKSEDNIGIGLHQDGYHPFPGLTFEDYECWEIIYNQNPFFKYKKQLKFLPTNLIDTNLMPNQRNDDMLLEEAYDNVISYLENNPIYIPLFLYTLYSFFSSLSKYMYIFEVKRLDDSDVIDKKDYLLLKDKIDDEDNGWLFFNFNLWLHTKNTNTLNIAANMFLNTFSYGYTSIKNPHNFHINISKEINTLSTKDINTSKNMCPRIATYENFKNTPILVYSEAGQLSSRSKIVQSILSDVGLWDTNFVFLAAHKKKNESIFDNFRLININLSNAKKISMREFHELKPYVNILYRHVVDSWQYWSEQPLQVYNSIRTPLRTFYTHNRTLYYSTNDKNSENRDNIESNSNVLKRTTYKELFYYNLYTSAVLFATLLRKTIPPSFGKALNAICNNDYNALIPKVDSHLDTDRDMFLNYLKTIIKEHINDSPQETVWLDEHKISAGQIEDVYSFNDKVVKEFLDKDIHNSSIALRKYLVSKNLLLKNDKRFVFNKNANSKKYYVYKIRAKYLS